MSFTVEVDFFAALEDLVFVAKVGDCVFFGTVLVLVVESVNKVVGFFLGSHVLLSFATGSVSLRSFSSAGTVVALFLVQLNIISIEILCISKGIGSSSSSVSNLSQILIIHAPPNVPQLGQSLTLSERLLRIVIALRSVHFHPIRNICTFVDFKMLYVNFMK